MYQAASTSNLSKNTPNPSKGTGGIHLDLFPNSTRVLLNKKCILSIKTLLRKLFCDRKGIAKHLGISVHSLDHYLYGNRAIPLPVLLKISETLEISISNLEQETISILLAGAKLKISNPNLPIIKNPIFYMIPVHLLCDGTEKSIYFQEKTELINLFKLKLNHVFGNVETSLVKKKDSECYVLGSSFLIPRFYNDLYPEIDYKAKKLPTSWLSLPSDYLSAMLAAFIIDEGYLYYGNYITISNTSEHLHNYVLSICHKLGYRVSESFRNDTKVHAAIIYDVKKLFETHSKLRVKFGAIVGMGYKELEAEKYLWISQRAEINRHLQNGKKRIIMALQQNPKGLSLKKLLFRSKLSKTTAIHHLQNLIKNGAVARDKYKCNAYLYKLRQRD